MYHEESRAYQMAVDIYNTIKWPNEASAQKALQRLDVETQIMLGMK
jgi:hypothetical protein